MENKNSIKFILLTLYKEGKSEVEAFNEIVESHSSNSVSKRTVSNWYRRFESGDFSLENNAKASVREKLPDEYIVNLIKENPELSIAELARIAGISYFNLRNRIIQLNSIGENVYKFKDLKKVSDEFIIDLVNNNPNLNLSELAKIANISPSTLSSRINVINKNGKKANYVKKKRGHKPNEKPVQKFTDEYLINLINENPDLNMMELAGLAGVTISTICTRIKKINRLNERVNYRNKSIIKITDEDIVDLVNNNPELSMDELAKLASISTKTISKRIDQLNSKGKSINYVNKKRIEFNYETYNKPGPKQKFTDEYLIDLIKENPGLSKIELAKLANVSYDTMLTRIKQVKSIKKN
jgi:DNA-binding MarR family transcriptional regulator